MSGVSLFQSATEATLTHLLGPELSNSVTSKSIAFVIFVTIISIYYVILYIDFLYFCIGLVYI